MNKRTKSSINQNSIGRCIDLDREFPYYPSALPKTEALETKIPPVSIECVNGHCTLNVILGSKYVCNPVSNKYMRLNEHRFQFCVPVGYIVERYKEDTNEEPKTAIVINISTKSKEKTLTWNMHGVYLDIDSSTTEPILIMYPSNKTQEKWPNYVQLISGLVKECTLEQASECILQSWLHYKDDSMYVFEDEYAEEDMFNKLFSLTGGKEIKLDCNMFVGINCPEILNSTKESVESQVKKGDVSFSIHSPEIVIYQLVRKVLELQKQINDLNIRVNKIGLVCSGNLEK